MIKKLIYLDNGEVLEKEIKEEYLNFETNEIMNCRWLEVDCNGGFCLINPQHIVSITFVEVEEDIKCEA